jgi:acetoin utilization protein AcuB
MDLSTLSAMPSIKLVMTPFPYFVEQGDPLDRAREMMKSHGVHHIPVQEKGQLIGTLSTAKVERSFERAAISSDAFDLRVGDVECKPAYVVDLSHPLDEVLYEMASRHLGSVLVTKRGKLVGIFSISDACRALADLLRRKYRPSGGEAA